MLLTLNAPRAYLPFNAFANRSRVCVNGINLFGYGLNPAQLSPTGAQHSLISAKGNKK
jgi:hypothetical protein